MYSWVEMGHAIGSLHHKSLHHKTKDIVIHVRDEDLMIYEKLKTGSKKKDAKEEEIEHNKEGKKKGKVVRIEMGVDKKRRVERIEESIEKRRTEKKRR